MPFMYLVFKIPQSSEYSGMSTSGGISGYKRRDFFIKQEYHKA